MRYLSLFSGIEAASVAWEPLGWECVGVAEIEKFPCAVLQHHYPRISNLGDVTKITDEQIAALGPIDLIVGGFPCQDVSVAGKRKGFEYEGERTRSGLFHDAMRIVRAAKQHCGLRFLLLENVPGIFSSSGGNDFATVVNEILGTNFIVPKNKWQKAGVAVGPQGMLEWATLDAQYFGLAQRRKRMFALADFGDWASRPPVLLESQGVCGDTPPSREKGEITAPTLDVRAGRSGETTFHTSGGLAFAQNTREEVRLIGGDGQIDGALAAEPGMKQQTYLAIPINMQCAVKTGAKSPNGTGVGKDGDPANTLGANDKHAVAIGWSEELTAHEDLAGTIQYGGQCGRHDGVMTPSMAVRRLTPKECERLQGFPDNYTLLPLKKPADGPRYKALGNSFAVPVVAWIGRKLEEVLRV